MYDTDTSALWNELPTATCQDLEKLAVGDLLISEMRELGRDEKRPTAIAAGQKLPCKE